MKTFLNFLIIAFTMCAVSCGNTNSPQQLVHNQYTINLQKFADQTRQLINVFETGDTTMWQPTYLESRKRYKHIEIFTEYFHPTMARAINGAAVQDADPNDNTVIIEPSGFQVMEEFLFPAIDKGATKVLVDEAKKLHEVAMQLLLSSANVSMTDTNIFDALRLQLFRMITMGITGADNAIALQGVNEARVSMEAWYQYINCYQPTDSLHALYTSSLTYLQPQNDFNLFDRASFISDYINPLCRSLYSFQLGKAIAFADDARLLHTTAATLFDSAAFNAWFFAPAAPNYNNDAMAQLGEKLFFDKRLSGNGSRSCASCHMPAKGFSDGEIRSFAINQKDVVLRNTPTIQYAALQPVQFADSRITFLEDQAKDVIENVHEMHGNLQLACANLSNDKEYATAFKTAFEEPVITPKHITSAIAAFIRTKSVFTARFDKYMRGDKNMMNNEELHGFNLFAGKAKCATCHFLPLFNGVVPPAFAKMESEILGVPVKNISPFILDTDEGKFNATGSSIHRFAFKTPTLRNVEHTAPYMHNGALGSLEEVIEFYDEGGGEGLGMKVPGQTLPADNLNLSDKEKTALIAFMKTLSDN